MYLMHSHMIDHIFIGIIVTKADKHVELFFLPFEPLLAPPPEFIQVGFFLWRWRHLSEVMLCWAAQPSRDHCSHPVDSFQFMIEKAFQAVRQHPYDY